MTGLLAHAAPISYKFPLPIWLYVVAGGAAVLLSAPAAALAVTEGDAIERDGADVYRFVRRLGPVLTLIGGALIVVALARGNGGLITAADVEADEALASDQPTVSAAARAFAGSTNVFAVPREDDGWFPYSEIRITVL